MLYLTSYGGDSMETLVQASSPPSPCSFPHHLPEAGSQGLGVGSRDREFRFDAESEGARSSMTYLHEVTAYINNGVLM